MNIDLIENSKKISFKIKQLEKGRDLLDELSAKKAVKVAEYEKNLAIVIIKLKNGQELELDGEKIKNAPASVLEKIARGICYKEKLEMEEAEAILKACYIKMNSLASELMALQSLNKNLKYEI